MKQHVLTTGRGAPARLRSAHQPKPAAEAISVTQKETAGALQGITAAIESQHGNFARPKKSASELAGSLKAKLFHCAAWLAVAFKGVGL